MISFSVGKIFRIFSIGMLIPISSILAQNTYSLSELTDSALKHLPLLMGKRAEMSGSQAAIIDTRHQFIPFLRANAQVAIGSDNSLPGSYFSLGIIPSTSAGLHSTNNGQAALGSIGVVYGEYTLLDFGYRKASIQSALADYDLQSADYDKLAYQVKADITRLYFTLLKQQMQQEVERQNRERYAKIFNVIHALAASGIKPGADSSLAKAELSKSITTYNQSVGFVNSTREQLAYYTGIPTNQLMLNTDSVKKNDILISLLRDSVASLTNPLIAYYANINKVYASNENRIAKSFQPTFSILASTWTRASSITPDNEYKSWGNGLGVQRYNYLAGVSFQYDLFNGVHKKDKLAAIHFRQEAGKRDLEQQQLALQSASNQADLAIETAELNLKELPVQIQSAEDTYNQKTAQYKAGLISLIDLTNAAFVLNRSQNDFTETITDWYLALINKAVAAGSLDRFIQTIK